MFFDANKTGLHRPFGQKPLYGNADDALLPERSLHGRTLDGPSSSERFSKSSTRL
jgi:hypothetical protein